MATTPTKILVYDLEDKLVQLIQDLIRVQGSYSSIYERLTNINTELMDKDTKNAIQDLLDGYNDSGKLTIERIDELKFALQAALTDLNDGSEKFTYDDESGNVITHTIKNTVGDTIFQITYHYSNLKEGVLSYSEKKFKDEKLNDITVRKDYTYNDKGNITDIATATTIVAPTV